MSFFTIFHHLFQNSALISARQMAQRGFLPTAFCCVMIRTHVSQTGTFEGLSTSVPWLPHLSNRPMAFVTKEKKLTKKTF